MNLLSVIEKENESKIAREHFDVGDMVEVHTWITEGDKRRIQRFGGLITTIKHGRGVRGTFTVRRIVAGEGVERVFPFHSPNVEKVEVKRNGNVRRSKLYYLRDRIGKEALKVPELVAGPRFDRKKQRIAELELAGAEKKTRKKRGRKRVRTEGDAAPKGKKKRSKKKKKA